jgi:hypothetical protein
MSSTRSRVYLFHLVPARIQDRWTMTAAAKTAGTSEFTCTVELIMNPLLRFLGGTSGLSPAIRRHTLIETRGFADDIVRKAKAAHHLAP